MFYIFCIVFMAVISTCMMYYIHYNIACTSHKYTMYLGIVSVFFLFIVIVINGYSDRKTAETSSSQIYLSIPDDTKERLLRLPRGFDKYSSVVNYLVDKGALKDTETTSSLLEPLTVASFCDLITSYCQNYYQFKDGFNDKICPDDIDVSKIPDSVSQYIPNIRYCLEHGFIGQEQAEEPEDVLTLNLFSRITYRIAYNSISYTEPDDEHKKVVLSHLDVKPPLDENPPQCRIHKLVFLASNDILPETNQGIFDMEKPMTRLDALCALVQLSDQIDLLGTDSTDPNKGCQPCQTEALTQQRASYHMK